MAVEVVAMVVVVMMVVTVGESVSWLVSCLTD